MARALLLISLLALVAAPAASAHYPAKGKDCGSIQFTPQSDHGSSDIRAKRTSCRTARRIVRKWDKGNKSPLGFTCRARAHDEQLGHSDVKCTRGDRRVTFAAF